MAAYEAELATFHPTHTPPAPRSQPCVPSSQGWPARGFSSLFITSGIHRPELEAAPEALEPLYAQYGATPTYVLRDLVW